jgi:adenine phosphoribosyltransferase
LFLSYSLIIVGKTPGEVKSLSYLKEYGLDTFEIQVGSVKPGSSCILVDDLLATGGSLKTSTQLIKSVGSKVVGAVILIELKDLNGRQHLSPIPVFSVVTY